MLGDHQVKCQVNGLRLGAGLQEPLGPLDLGGVEPEMLVCDPISGSALPNTLRISVYAMNTREKMMNIALEGAQDGPSSMLRSADLFDRAWLLW